ncbi:MAG: hypothetical protein ACK5KU_09025 [Beutenbergiaceae bacterium]
MSDQEIHAEVVRTAVQQLRIVADDCAAQFQALGPVRQEQGQGVWSDHAASAQFGHKVATAVGGTMLLLEQKRARIAQLGDALLASLDASIAADELMADDLAALNAAVDAPTPEVLVVDGGDTVLDGTQDAPTAEAPGSVDNPATADPAGADAAGGDSGSAGEGDAAGPVSLSGASEDGGVGGGNGQAPSGGESPPSGGETPDGAAAGGVGGSTLDGGTSTGAGASGGVGADSVDGGGED